MTVVAFKYFDDSELDLEFDKRKHNILASAYYGDLDGIKAAVEEDALAVRLKDDRTGCNALHLSAGLGNYSCVEFLLRCQHIDLRDEDFSGLTALERAAVTGNDAVFALIADAILPSRHSENDGPAAKIHKLVPRP